MASAFSRLTAQGQVSVPAEVRRRLGLTPGSILEWDARGEAFLVRRAGRYTSTEVHRALFKSKPTTRSLSELKAGVATLMRKKHARR